VLSVLIIRLPKLGTHVHLIREGEAFKEMYFTHVFLFPAYNVYVTTASSLIKLSYVCVLKHVMTLPKFNRSFKRTSP
jgi:hypothetical protein